MDLPSLPPTMLGRARAQPRVKEQTPPYHDPDRSHTWLIPNFMVAVYYPNIPYEIVFMKYKESGTIKYNLVAIYDKNTDTMDYPTREAIQAFKDQYDTNIDRKYFTRETIKYYNGDDKFWQDQRLYTSYVQQNLLSVNDLYQIFKVVYPQFNESQRRHIDSIDRLYYSMRGTIIQITYNPNKKIYDDDDKYPDNVINFVKQYVAQKGYVYKYFTAINPNSIEAQAGLGQLNLSFDNFEQASDTFSLEEGEHMMYEIQNNFKDDEYSSDPYEKIFYGQNSAGPTVLYLSEPIYLSGFQWPNEFGWDKQTLFNAILKSGLMQPNGQQWQFKNITKHDVGEDRQLSVVKYVLPHYDPKTGNKQDYHSTANYINRSDEYIKQQIEQTLFRKNNGILWRQVGINTDGFISALQRSVYVQSKNALGAIYRRIFGTVYTINWNRYCASQKLNYMPLEVLQNILEVYYGQVTNIDPKKLTCQAIESATPQIMNMIQGFNSPEQWLQNLQQQYINSNTFKQSGIKTVESRKKRKTRVEEE